MSIIKSDPNFPISPHTIFQFFKARQIWNYIDAQLQSGTDISPGVIFKKRPKDKDRMKLIEKLFDDEGIPVVWEDESIEERKERG